MLKGKTALITGSTQGIGRAIAERLAAEGCNVVMNGLGKPAAIEANRSRIAETHGTRVVYHGADLARPAEIGALVETALTEFGGIDILVNSAVVRHFAPIEAFKPEDWDRRLAVNLSSAFHTTRPSCPAYASATSAGSSMSLRSSDCVP
jgi:3-hydroxybutyrate dehydrogenase